MFKKCETFYNNFKSNQKKKNKTKKNIELEIKKLDQ